VGTTGWRGQKCRGAIYFDLYHSVPNIPEKLHEDTVSKSYGLLVNICTVFHLIPAIALFLWYTPPPPKGARTHHCRGFTITPPPPPTHTYTVELLWMSDQPVAETSTWQHTTPTRDTHVPGGIRTPNPSKRAVAHPRLRLRAIGIGFSHVTCVINWTVETT